MHKRKNQINAKISFLKKNQYKMNMDSLMNFHLFTEKMQTHMKYAKPQNINKQKKIPTNSRKCYETINLTCN